MREPEPGARGQGSVATGSVGPEGLLVVERFLGSSTPHREVFTRLRPQIVSSHDLDQRLWASQLGRDGPAFPSSARPCRGRAPLLDPDPRRRCPAWEPCAGVDLVSVSQCQGEKVERDEATTRRWAASTRLQPRADSTKSRDSSSCRTCLSATGWPRRRLSDLGRTCSPPRRSPPPGPSGIPQGSAEEVCALPVSGLSVLVPPSKPASGPLHRDGLRPRTKEHHDSQNCQKCWRAPGFSITTCGGVCRGVSGSSCRLRQLGGKRHLRRWRH
ncbi:hypothetical protein FB382_003139 [Nocardioides ginsengisegetis]|uniref:Uncharacterized protein n=1 Tax=Nocardioides ginsengisegetis TaxID=661491 RepID=A0A7W3J208_9ACTN|nr:hypothetical protein [Nocardioides ginsengisegetis]